MEKETGKGPKSKVWLIKANKFGGNCSKVLAYEYSPADALPIDDRADVIGIVLDHGEPIIHVDGSPAKEYPAHALYTTVDVSHLEGELLTLVDASFSDKQQRESFKSLIRQTVWRFNSNMERRVQEVFEYVKRDDGKE